MRSMCHRPSAGRSGRDRPAHQRRQRAL